jgi:endonuclease/exonuclease/phosphatase family metal-dependent hydrolase
MLTRFEIASHQNDKLPNVANGEQRGILSVSIRLPNQQESISVFATHFDHRRSDEERVLSGEQANAMVDGKGLAILMGDINDIIGSRTMDLLDRNWKRVNDVPLPTIPVSEPKRQIDFILVRPVDRWKMVEAKVVEEPIASDHRPFFAVIEFH